jgi:hypothetical protein
VSTSTIAGLSAARARATGPAARAVTQLCAALDEGLAGRTAAAVLYFASADYDPADLAGPISAHFPGAQVMGCSSAGEFTDQGSGTNAITAIALPEGILVRTSAALGELDPDITTGTDAAIAQIEATFGPLRDLDPATHLGFVLIDGMHGSEEAVTERLGNAAPILGVVGASAGDDLAFARTWVAVGNTWSWHGVAFLVAQIGVPFRTVKTCSFTSTGTRLRITKADVANRTVLEFDGKPATQAYAQALGISPEAVDSSVFMSHPVGLMLDDEAWIRSPQTTVAGGGLKFYAQILEGMDVEIMTSSDLVGATRSAIGSAVDELGGTAGGALMFNCILRRLELDASGQGQAFVDTFAGVPTAGFHTYGETWLGHVNQTLTGVIFG